MYHKMHKNLGVPKKAESLFESGKEISEKFGYTIFELLIS